MMHKTQTLELARADNTFTASFSIVYSTAEQISAHAIHLHPSEKIYFGTLAFAKRKHSFLLGRMAAKRAVCDIVKGLPPESFGIIQGIFQQPIVQSDKNHNVQVSITHCYNIGAAIAFPDAHPMGIDLEKIDAGKIPYIKEQLTTDEIDLITKNQLNFETAVFLLWSIKEALSKTLKTGLMMDFTIAEINSLQKEQEGFTGSFKNFAQYKFFTFTEGEYVCSIVVPKRTTVNLAGVRQSFKEVVSIAK